MDVGFEGFKGSTSLSLNACTSTDYSDFIRARIHQSRPETRKLGATSSRLTSEPGMEETKHPTNEPGT
jgi:hypothetical protein